MSTSAAKSKLSGSLQQQPGTRPGPAVARTALWSVRGSPSLTCRDKERVALQACGCFF